MTESDGLTEGEEREEVTLKFLELGMFMLLAPIFEGWLFLGIFLGGNLVAAVIYFEMINTDQGMF